MTTLKIILPFHATMSAVPIRQTANFLIFQKQSQENKILTYPSLKYWKISRAKSQIKSKE